MTSSLQLQLDKAAEIRSILGDGDPDRGRLIPLGARGHALVDVDDYDWVMQWKWHISPSAGGKLYAVRRLRTAGAKSYVRMHRVIVGARSDQIVDHINGITLDNRRVNLRACTQGDNLANQQPGRIGTSSHFKGVSYFRQTRKWQAYINKHGKRYHLGYFETPEEAAKTYNAAAAELFGEYAWVNEL